jgi:hypothetical protein
VQQGPWWGGASPLPPPVIDSSGGAARRGVLLPGAARGQSPATKGECQITLKSRADIFWTDLPKSICAAALSPFSHSIPPDPFLPPPPPFCLALSFTFFKCCVSETQGRAAASLCAAADYDPAREREDDNDDDKDFAWGGEGHRHNHPGLDDQGDSPKRRPNRLKTLPSMADPLVADG